MLPEPKMTVPCVLAVNPVPVTVKVEPTGPLVGDKVIDCARAGAAGRVKTRSDNVIEKNNARNNLLCFILFPLIRYWHGKSKTAAFSHLTLYFDTAAVSLDQALGDGESQTNTSRGPAPRRVNAIEALKHTGQVFLRDALAGVCHGDPGQVARCLG